MRSVARYILCSLALAVSVAAPVQARTGTEMRGFIMETLDGLSFTRCGGRTAAVVVDGTPAQALSQAIGAIRPVMSDQSRPIYVELAGQPAGNRLNVTRLLRLIGHVEDCASAPTDVPAGTRLAAVGIDEPWSLVVTAAGATFRAIAAKPSRFGAAAFARPTAEEPGRRTFDAWSQLDGGTLRIEFVEELCLDTGAEAAYGARVTGRFGHQALEGCASRY